MRPLRPSCPFCPFLLLVTFAAFAGVGQAADPKHPTMVWVKQHPKPDAKIPSPRLGYECAYGYDPAAKLLIRWAGHNQGGGGEQHSETWTYDLDKDRWTLKQPNDAPPGACCNVQNAFHDGLGKFVRFPAFSNSHGWQSAREVYLRNTSVWTYDLPGDTWTNMRPMPEPQLHPLRGAAYDPDHEVIVIHGGEGAQHSTLAYDLYTNTWHWLKPKTAPPTNLSQPGFAYDAVNKVFVLFGSQFQSHPETWIFDLPKNAWKVLKTNTTPPFDKSSPVLAADTRNGIVLCSVKGTDGVETWVLNVAKAEWKKLDVKWDGDGQDKSMNGTRNRILLYLPDRNLFVQEIRTNKEQQIWTFRYAEAAEPLPKVKEFTIGRSKAAEIVLTWKNPADGGDWRNNIYRGTGNQPWAMKWKLIAKDIKPKMNGDVAVFKVGEEKPGGFNCYRVHAVTPDGKEGPASGIARSQPPIVNQLRVSVLEPKKTYLYWQQVLNGTIGYHVERAEVLVYSTDQVKNIKQRLQPTSELAAGAIKQIGPFKRLTAKPLSDTEYVDATVEFEAGQVKSIDKTLQTKEKSPDQLEPDGKPYKVAVYAYRIIAVGNLGMESGPSPLVFTIPSAPQHVFAKEVGKTATALKWAANPEKNLKGYHVYRHDGRFSNAKIVRLTKQPIRETEFLDKDSGDVTRRYEIVAVDVMDQEGIPSQPVWSRREWAPFYTPYAKEWHQ